jgi:hypothetical protein
LRPRRASSPAAAARAAPLPERQRQQPPDPSSLLPPLPPPRPAEVTKALATARGARDVAAVLATAADAGCPLDALHAAAALNRLAHVQEGPMAAGRALPSRRPSSASPNTGRLLAALAARVAAAVAADGDVDDGFGGSSSRRRHGRRRAGPRRQQQQQASSTARQASGALWALGKYAAVVVADTPEEIVDEHEDDDDDEAVARAVASAAERALWPPPLPPPPLQASALALAEALLEDGGGGAALREGNPLDVANAAWALARLQMAAAAAERARMGARRTDGEDGADANTAEDAAPLPPFSSSSPFLDPHRSAAWWATLTALAAERAAEFKTQELVNVAWALAQSRRLLLSLSAAASAPPSPALAAFVRTAAERLSRPETAGSLSPQLVANAAWALARLAPDALSVAAVGGGDGDGGDAPAPPPPVSPRLLGEAGAALATRGAAVAYRMKAQGISNLLWSLATLRDAASAHLKRQKQQQKAGQAGAAGA